MADSGRGDGGAYSLWATVTGGAMGRYFALAVYAGVLQALGLLIAVFGIVVGVGAGLEAPFGHGRDDRLAGWALGIGFGLGCCAAGVVVAAIGQFCQVVMDIEENTRPALAVEENSSLDWG
jgi:hypothetical protein